MLSGIKPVSCNEEVDNEARMQWQQEPNAQPAETRTLQTGV